MNVRKYIDERKKANAEKESSFSPQEAFSRYSGMSEEQLMREMFKAAEQGRKNGSLNNDTLDSFYRNAQAFLTPEQAERMKELITELKK